MGALGSRPGGKVLGQFKELCTKAVLEPVAGAAELDSGKLQGSTGHRKHFSSGGFPGGPVVKISTLQCRGRGFNPWFGN